MQINLKGGQLNIVSDNGSITVNDDKVSINNKKSYTAHKEGKDYRVNGTDGEIERNVYVKGNIIVSGYRHIMLSGEYDPTLKDLVIEGNLIVDGSGHDIQNIVRLDGHIVDNSYRSIIQ